MNPQDSNPAQPQIPPQPVPQSQVPVTPQPATFVVENAVVSTGMGLLPKIIIGLVITAVVGGGGYFAYQKFVKTGKIVLPSALNLSSIPGVSQVLPTKPISKIEAFQMGTKTMSWDITTKKMNWDYAALLSLGSKIQNVADATPTYKVTYADGSTKDFTLTQMQEEMKKPEVLKQLGMDASQTSSLFRASQSISSGNGSFANLNQTASGTAVASHIPTQAPPATEPSMSEAQFKAIAPTEGEVGHNLKVQQTSSYFREQMLHLVYSRAWNDTTSPDVVIYIDIFYGKDNNSMAPFGKSNYKDAVNEESLDLSDSVTGKGIMLFFTDSKISYRYMIYGAKGDWGLSTSVGGFDKETPKQEAIRLMNIMLSRIPK